MLARYSHNGPGNVRKAKIFEGNIFYWTNLMLWIEINNAAYKEKIYKTLDKNQRSGVPIQQPRKSVVCWIKFLSTQRLQNQSISVRIWEYLVYAACIHFINLICCWNIPSAFRHFATWQQKEKVLTGNWSSLTCASCMPSLLGTCISNSRHFFPQQYPGKHVCTLLVTGL